MNISSIKKTNLIVGCAVILWLLVLYSMESIFEEYCIGGLNLCNSVHNILAELSGMWIFFLVPFAVFSVLFFFLRNEVYKYWSYFSYVWLPISLLLVSISDSTNNGSMSLPSPSSAGIMFLALVFLYIILSISLIVWKHFSLRRN